MRTQPYQAFPLLTSATGLPSNKPGALRSSKNVKHFFEPITDFICHKNQMRQPSPRRERQVAHSPLPAGQQQSPNHFQLRDDLASFAKSWPKHVDEGLVIERGGDDTVFPRRLDG